MRRWRRSRLALVGFVAAPFACDRPLPPPDEAEPLPTLPAERCEAIDTAHPRTFTFCSKGSGSFGRWGLDEAGLPTYEYGIDQALDDRAAYFTTETLDGKKAPPRNHWAAFGNHRVNGTFSNDGVISIATQDRGVEYLNVVDDDHGYFGGGFSYVDDGEETFSTSFRDRPDGAATRRVFGMGYAEAITVYRDVMVRRRTYAPWGDAPYVVDEVTVTNLADEPKDIAHFEVFDVARRPIDINWAVSGVVPSVPQTVRDLRDASNAHFDEAVSFEPALNRLALRRSHAAGFAPLAKDEPAASNDYPPDPFLEVLVGDADDTFTDKATFFGSGSRAAPETVGARAEGEGRAPGARGAMLNGLGQPRMFGIKTDLRIAGGGEEHLRFAYGYAPMGESIDVDPRLRDPAFDGLAEYRRELAKRSFAFASPDEPALTRELAWHAYSIEASVGRRDYFEGPVVPQGSAYLYLHGADGAARDLGLFALPLIYFDPELARAELELYMRIQLAADGRFSYAFQGHGMLDDAGVHHAPSDLDLFFLWALSEYIGATGDERFMAAKVPFWPKTARPAATVHQHVVAAVRHLFDSVGTGDHGLIRVGTGDWSDGIVFEAPLPDRKTVIEKGESVPNTQMAIAVLPRVADLLSDSEPELADEIRGHVEAYRAALPSAWGGSFFGRAYFADDTLVRGDRVDLEAQVWSLIGSSFASEADRDSAIEAIQSQLDEPSPAGAMLQADGQVWPAISALLTEGYAVSRPDLAWSHFKRNTLIGHASAYPDVWFGIWSAPDGMNGPVGDRPGGTWYSLVTPMTDYPTQNNNAHALPLYAALRMAGVSATAHGLRVAPKVPGDDFVLETQLVDVRRTPGGLAVRYAPPGEALRKVTIVAPQGTLISDASLDGAAQELLGQVDHVDFLVLGGSGTELHFQLTLVPAK